MNVGIRIFQRCLNTVSLNELKDEDFTVIYAGGHQSIQTECPKFNSCDTQLTLQTFLQEVHFFCLGLSEEGLEMSLSLKGH